MTICNDRSRNVANGLHGVRLSVLIVFTACFSSITHAEDQSIDGTWRTADGEGLITIRNSDAGPVGKIAGSRLGPELRQPERKDDLNPDPALRDRPLLGMVIMAGFEEDGESRWKEGYIYDPNNGKSYKCKLKLVDADTLEVRGYIGVSWLGRTETWVRHVDLD